MGDPTGIGPEIVLKALAEPLIYTFCRPLVIGDVTVLGTARTACRSRQDLKTVKSPDAGAYACGSVDVLNLSRLAPANAVWGRPTAETGRAMVDYIIAAIDMACQGSVAAMVTAPINKQAMRLAGFDYNGHTELLATRTRTSAYVMMLAGERLRVALVTIHTSLKTVCEKLSRQRVLQTIRITGQALAERFGFKNARIAVAGLIPHAGEGGLFGNEEAEIIAPAVTLAREEGFNVSGPWPADTLFYHALQGRFDAVVAMYHDQGLIPFKLIHFTDGVNTTLGLPIIRTSVDHGTAYDIAGTGKADPGSLLAAIGLAARQAQSAAKAS